MKFISFSHSHPTGPALGILKVGRCDSGRPSSWFRQGALAFWKSPLIYILSLRLFLLFQVSNETVTLEESLRRLSSTERIIFFSVFLIIFIVAVIGNVAAIIATYKRFLFYNIHLKHVTNNIMIFSKHRCIQKTCIISLALSDLIMVTSCSINHLETFSHPLINWVSSIELECVFR